MGNAPPTPGSPAQTWPRKGKKSKKGSQREWRCADPSLLFSGEDDVEQTWPSLGAEDPFGTFLASRPRPPKRLPKGSRELRLRLLETKAHLLQACLSVELDQLKPASNPFAEPRTRLDLQARRYLRNPDRVLDVMSDAGSDSDVESEAADEIIEDQEVRPVLRASASAPSLGMKPTRSSTNLLPPISSSSKSAAVRPGLGNLHGWWTSTRTWNAGLSRDRMRLRRLDASVAGGCVALGDGKLEMVHDSTPNHGYYYALRIEAVDDVNFPLKEDGNEKTHVLSSGFGFSKLPPCDPSCEKPMFAYEIPDSVVVGYNGHLISNKRWTAVDWDPKNLQVGDILGMFIALRSADLFVLVNGEVKLRLATSLKPDKDAPTSQHGVKQIVWPLVDLHGRITAVSLLTDELPPPNPIR